MAGRIQSPSSINMYKQCPRKYYYRYIEKLPTRPSIHLVRGSIAHLALEHFFEDTPEDKGDWRTTLQYHILNLLNKFWDSHKEELESLDVTPEELQQFKEETAMMLVKWEQDFSERLQELMDAGKTYEEAFKEMTPEREKEYRDEELKVRGFIDAIENTKGLTVLMDYKTSKKPEITPDYRLQLGIYALMYLRKHGEIPDGVGIHFLRHERQLLDVDDDLLLDAQFEIEQVHSLTQTTDIRDYPKQESPLCNWCDFYDTCFKKSS